MYKFKKKNEHAQWASPKRFKAKKPRQVKVPKVLSEKRIAKLMSPIEAPQTIVIERQAKRITVLQDEFEAILKNNNIVYLRDGVWAHRTMEGVLIANQTAILKNGHPILLIVYSSYYNEPFFQEVRKLNLPTLFINHSSEYPRRLHFIKACLSSYPASAPYSNLIHSTPFGWREGSCLRHLPNDIMKWTRLYYQQLSAWLTAHSHLLDAPIDS